MKYKSKKESTSRLGESHRRFSLLAITAKLETRLCKDAIKAP